MTNHQQTKRAAKARTKSPGAVITLSLPVHDLKGVVVFPMPSALKAILGETGFENLSAELSAYDFDRICRTPEVIVYMHLTPIVVPMDLTSSQVLPLSNPAAFKASNRRAERKTSTTKK